jgi:hypothetical protein
MVVTGILHQEISRGGGLFEFCTGKETSHSGGGGELTNNHNGGGGLLEGFLHQGTSHGYFAPRD